MKKTRCISTLLLAAAVLCMLAGCGGTPAASDTPSPSASDVASPSAVEDSSPSPSGSTPAAQSSEPAASPSESAQPSQTEAKGSTGGGKTLIVYYSASGRTEAVAGYIANATGGDTFAITPAEPYTSDDLDWTNSDSRVSREHDDPSLRTMELAETAVDGWENYDTVFIGYPIWWGIAAWPVDNFVSANDFTGKTVIPFCTSSSSGLGESGELLAELAGTGNWQEGRRFRSGAAEADVAEWVNDLDLPKAPMTDC